MATNTDKINEIISKDDATLEEIIVYTRDADISFIIQSNDKKLTYNEINQQLTELKDYLGQIEIDWIDALPNYRQTELNGFLKPIFQQLRVIKTKNFDDNQPAVEQRKPVVNFFTVSDQHFQNHKLKINELIRDIKFFGDKDKLDDSDLKQKLKTINEAETSANQMLGQLKDIIGSAKTDLAKGGVGKHSEIFDEQATKHYENSEKWENYTIGLLITTVVVAITFFTIVIFFIDDKTKMIEAGLIGAVIISLFSYAIVLCARNYFAEKHNESVNQHKANCLGSYNTFIDSADDERKAAVLLFATQTIFSHQKSGYLTKDSDTQNPNPFIEIIKTISSKATTKSS